MSRRARAARAAGPADSPAPRHRGFSLSSRLATTVLGVGFVSMVVATLMGVNAGQSLGREIADDALESLRTTATAEVSAQLSYYERLAEQLAGSPQAKVAIAEFSSGLSELSSTPRTELRTQYRTLLEAYLGEYFAPLEGTGDTVQLSDILSNNSGAVYLQHEYSIPEEPIKEPIAVDDAGDDSDWSAVHARFHPGFRTAVIQGELVDIYLVDAATERVVYSAAKRPDLGTSLAVGPFSGSIVARAADEATDRDDGIVTDLSFYRAHPEGPIGAAAAPVRHGEQVVGSVVIAYDAEVYTQRLADLAAASAREDSGQGTSDLYLVAGDGRTRSDPQTYLADPPAFLDASVAAGVLTEAGRARIERNGTTVLVQPADDATVNAAQDQVTGVGAGTGLTGDQVLVALEAVPEDDVAWYTVAEMAVAAAEETVDSFRSILLFGSSAFLVVLAFVAVAWAKSFMRPVRAISERLGRNAIAREVSEDLEPVRIPDRSPIEFHRLVESLAEMRRSLRRQQRELQEARAHRVGVLESMVPPAVAQRIARGDIESLDEVPSASVVVVVVLGLGDLLAQHRGGERGLIDELHAELDTIAMEHGFDRVKVVGDSYFAACGHDRPYIDHAPRAVAFAESVTAEVAALGRSTSVSLATAVGINTGKVTVGMSGGTRLVYDVWGPTVTVAHALARLASGGEILITGATRARLPEDVEVTAWHDGGPAHPSLADGGDVWAVVVPEESQERPAGTGARR